MRTLSVSAAWDETTAILARDGRLLVSVGLALIALPSAINSVVNPGGVNSASAPAWTVVVALIASLIALAGQLALIRLVLGPSITVGGAIIHGLRRMPIYFVSAVLIIIGLLVIGIPIGLALSALGVPLSAKPPASPALTVAVLFYVAIIAFLGVRLLMTAPVASGEAAGPIAIIKRSWLLTNGHWWRLFGFLLAFVVAAIIALVAVGSAAGIVIQLVIGSVQPMSAGALILALLQALVSAAVTTLFAVMLARIYLQLAGTADQSGTPWR
jgi:hypothetical protein